MKKDIPPLHFLQNVAKICPVVSHYRHVTREKTFIKQRLSLFKYNLTEEL